jgi:hypothetical protein
MAHHSGYKSLYSPIFGMHNMQCIWNVYGMYMECIIYNPILGIYKLNYLLIFMECTPHFSNHISPKTARTDERKPVTP